MPPFHPIAENGEKRQWRRVKGAWEQETLRKPRIATSVFGEFGQSIGSSDVVKRQMQAANRFARTARRGS
jgi:hypothetical protein